MLEVRPDCFYNVDYAERHARCNKPQIPQTHTHCTCCGRLLWYNSIVIVIIQQLQLLCGDIRQCAWPLDRSNVLTRPGNMLVNTRPIANTSRVRVTNTYVSWMISINCTTKLSRLIGILLKAAGYWGRPVFFFFFDGFLSLPFTYQNDEY